VLSLLRMPNGWTLRLPMHAWFALFEIFFGMGDMLGRYHIFWSLVSQKALSSGVVHQRGGGGLPQSTRTLVLIIDWTILYQMLEE